MDNEYFKYASAHDIASIYMDYKHLYYEAKHNYENQIKEVLDFDCYVRITYNPKNEVYIQIFKPYADYPDVITFYKENGKLLFHANHLSNKNVLLISKFMPEMFDILYKAKFLLNTITANISNISSINSDYKLKINDDNVEIYKNDCIIKLSEREYNYNNRIINFDFVVETKFVDVLNEVQGNEKRIFKNINFNINDLPKFFANKLLEYKNDKLINKKKKQEVQKEKGLKKFLSLFK